MLEWWYLAQVWFGVSAGLLLVVLGLIGKKPSGFSVLLVGLVEFALLMQVVASVTVLFLGESSKGDTWEFFGYLLVALVVPVAGVFWALVERSKWSTVVMGAAVLTVVVMLVRMRQIWTGEVLQF